jgi:transcriptional regulator with GAF, ATPase, and Fis domain
VHGLRAALLTQLQRFPDARVELERGRVLAKTLERPALEAELEWAAALLETAALAPERAAEHRERARRAWDRSARSLPSELAEAFWSHPKRRAFTRERSEHSASERPALDAVRLLAMNRRLNSTFSPAAILEYALDAALELSGAERGFVLLRASGAFEIAAARGLSRERLESTGAEFSRGVAERVIREELPLVTHDAASDRRLSRSRSVHALELTAVACVPISSPDGVLGALYLDSRVGRGPLAAGTLEVLLAFADQVAIALRNARLRLELERRTLELEEEKRKVERLMRSKERRIEELSRELSKRQAALERRYDYSRIVGKSRVMQELFERLDRVVEANVPVLVHGESGTGKELVARALHFNGPRKAAPFLGINCAALPENLLESELFGHVRGAFTGADRDKEGLFVAARGGTLFLDELGELPLSMQAKLLRVLQEREVRPLGSEKTIAVDVRIVCATNRDLLAEVSAGRFREDLYYRVAVVDLALPALRERIEDVPLIAQAILARLAQERGGVTLELTPEALRALMSYPWPGNVRQLENVLTKASVLATGTRLEAQDLALPRAGKPSRSVRSRSEYAADEAQRILEALRASRWNVSEVSRALGIPRNTLYRKLEKYGLLTPTSATDAETPRGGGAATTDGPLRRSR